MLKFSRQHCFEILSNEWRDFWEKRLLRFLFNVLDNSRFVYTLVVVSVDVCGICKVKGGFIWISLPGFSLVSRLNNVGPIQAEAWVAVTCEPLFVSSFGMGKVRFYVAIFSKLQFKFA